MTRTRQQLELARDRQAKIVEFAQRELDAIEGEIASLDGNVPLDGDFLVEVLAPILFEESAGLTSAEIYEKITQRRFRVSRNGLRVFLSRNKDRGNLELVDVGSGLSRWRITSKTVDAALKRRVKLTT